MAQGDGYVLSFAWAGAGGATPRTATPAATPMGATTTQRRPREGEEHTGLTPAAKRPPPRPTPPEPEPHPPMSNAELTNILQQLFYQMNADRPWLAEMWESMVSHADSIDNVSHQLIRTQNTTEATLAATIAKAQRDVEEVASKTVGTFFETKIELDHMRLQAKNRII